MSSGVVIERTGQHAQRAEQWLDEYMAAFAAAGYPPDGCAIVRAHLDSLPWVSDLSEAHVRVASWHLRSNDKEPTQQETDHYMAGWRTWRAASDDQRNRHIAAHMDVRVEEVERWVDRFHDGELSPNETRECALYRHYDSDGALLYVGISTSPDDRHKQHERNSKWFKFVAATDVEWLDSSDAARAAERLAIEDESPLFNRTHNTKRQTNALEYLLERV